SHGSRTKYDLADDLTGKTYIVTGATSGIGQATAEGLSRRNARVIMACRNREKCVETRADIVSETGNKQVYCRQCDLSHFDSIVAFVSKLSKGKLELDRIDGVVHNAAVMEAERKENKDGIESTLATNHLGAFLMTGLLLEKLKAQPHPVRLVFVNHNFSMATMSLDFANLNEELRPEEPTSDEEKARPKEWDPYKAYRRSKLAEAMFARDLADKLNNSNISVTMAVPGWAFTNLTAPLDEQLFVISRWLLERVNYLVGEGRVANAVRPVLYAVADPEMEGKNGVFINRERVEQEWGHHVDEDEGRNMLWEESEKWTRFADRLSALNRSISGDQSTKTSHFQAVETKPGRSWRTLWL
ncbi:hypothetical protein PMAYCL1PPCAC_27396, partial [Pristionchus mayeri]